MFDSLLVISRLAAKLVLIPGSAWHSLDANTFTSNLVIGVHAMPVTNPDASPGLMPVPASYLLGHGQGHIELQVIGSAPTH